MKTKSFTKVTLLTIFDMSVITAVTLNSCQKEALKPKATTSPSSSRANLSDSRTAKSSSTTKTISDWLFILWNSTDSAKP